MLFQATQWGNMVVGGIPCSEAAHTISGWYGHGAVFLAGRSAGFIAVYSISGSSSPSSTSDCICSSTAQSHAGEILMDAADHRSDRTQWTCGCTYSRSKAVIRLRVYVIIDS